MTTLLAAAVSTLVFCAPGYPGASADAQPFVDQFAAAAVKSAGWQPGTLAAIYDPTDEGSVAKLASSDAVLAFVPYPFFVERGSKLHLTPLAQADVAGTGTTQKWSLVAKAGKVTGPGSLAGYTIVSVAGYAPEFVRHSALGSWGALPGDVKVQATGQILSALRKVASGAESSVALLDQQQATALTTLPFGNDIKPVTQSAALPVALIVVVDSRLPAPKAKTFQEGLLKMGKDSQDVLGQLKLQGFVMPAMPAGQ
jgi:hypothetical protein